MVLPGAQTVVALGHFASAVPPNSIVFAHGLPHAPGFVAMAFVAAALAVMTPTRSRTEDG